MTTDTRTLPFFPVIDVPADPATAQIAEIVIDDDTNDTPTWVNRLTRALIARLTRPAVIDIGFLPQV